MARPRKPTALLEASGAYKKDPQRRADREGEVEDVEDLGARPPGLPVAVAVVWDELVADCHKGVLTRADRQSLEIAARLMAEFRQRGADMEAGKIGRLQAALGELGMSPASRSKVKVARKPAARNPLADIFKPKAA